MADKSKKKTKTKNKKPREIPLDQLSRVSGGTGVTSTASTTYTE